MAHVVQQKATLLQRIRRSRGQVEALERAVACEQDCWDVLQLLAAARGAMNSLMAEVLEATSASTLWTTGAGEAPIATMTQNN